MEKHLLRLNESGAGLKCEPLDSLSVGRRREVERHKNPHYS